MIMTTKSKNPPNNEDETPPVGGHSGAGEFDLKADAAPVSPSTANEVDLLQYQVKDDYQGQGTDTPPELVRVAVGRPRDQSHMFAHPTYEGRFKLLELERTVECAKTVLKHGSPEIVRAVEMGELGVVPAAALTTAATNKSQQSEESELTSRPNTDPRTPPAIASDLPKVDPGVPNRGGSFREIAMLVVRVSTLSQACKDRAALILNPRIAAKLMAVPADERQRWITTVRDARETLSGFERQLQRAFKKAPAVPPANAAAASVADGDAPHPDQEEHPHG
jgi:hypothetical protein